MNKVFNHFKRKRKWNESDVNEMFDLICAGNHFNGMIEGVIDVDGNREAFKILKKGIKLIK